MIFIGLGSNIGDGIIQINKAINMLEKAGVCLEKKSSFYLSPAWGLEEQDDFVNAVIQIHTAHTPLKLLHVCLETENKMGRKRLSKWGPRLIDIDLLEYKRLEFETEELTLPHPWYTRRDFVLLPLAELAPGWVPTGDRRTVETLINLLPKRLIEIIPDHTTE